MNTFPVCLLRDKTRHGQNLTVPTPIRVGHGPLAMVPMPTTQDDQALEIEMATRHQSHGPVALTPIPANLYSQNLEISARHLCHGLVVVNRSLDGDPPRLILILRIRILPRDLVFAPIFLPRGVIPIALVDNKCMKFMIPRSREVVNALSAR
jgi:hypothetical protein